MLLLRCPACKQQMKCDPKPGELKGKSKRCVYCGRSFSIKGNIISRL
jgi:uncharacterized protein YbaR (Trm112 family)